VIYSDPKPIRYHVLRSRSLGTDGWFDRNAAANEALKIIAGIGTSLSGKIADL